jgi:hypothetical protein
MLSEHCSSSPPLFPLSRIRAVLKAVRLCFLALAACAVGYFVYVLLGVGAGEALDILGDTPAAFLPSDDGDREN